MCQSFIMAGFHSCGELLFRGPCGKELRGREPREETSSLHSPTPQKTKRIAKKPRYSSVVTLPALPPEQFAALRDNIAANGVLVPILVDCDGPCRKIIDGNYRKQIADELGYECPEIVHGGLDEEEMRTLARALNLARRQIQH